MNLYLLAKPALITAIASVAVVGLASWQGAPAAPKASTFTDTVPRTHHQKVKNIDEALRELEKGMQQLEKELQKPLPPVPPIEPAKIKADIENALQKVDVAKMEADLKASMKQTEVELAKAQADRQKNLKEIDAAKIKADAQAALAKVDFEKVQQEIEKIKQTDFKKLEEDLAKLGPQIEQSLKQAKQSMEEAKKDLTAYKMFIDALDKDGILDKDRPYTIEIGNDQLIINGKVQPAKVYNQHRPFLETHKNVTIKKTADDFTIDKD